MIVHFCVCDRCGTQTIIDKGTKAFQVVLKSYALSQHGFNDSFGNNWNSTKKSLLPTDQVDFINASFCDRECFLDFLKEKMLHNGMFHVTREELEKMEEDGKDEMQEIRNVAKQLRELEGLGPMTSPMVGAHRGNKDAK